MCRKMFLLISVVLMLGSVSNAEDIQWTDLGADHLWSTPENWDLGRVPTLADEVRIDVPAAAAPNGPVIQDGIDAKAKGILTEAPGEPTLTMTGGTLEVAEWIWYGDGADSFGIWDMSGGTVTVANEFELGWDGGAGTLTMTGGTINAGEAVIPTGSGAFGELFLNGGTYNVTKPGGLNVKENGLIDITEGTLVLEGDETAKVNDLIAAGLITAYGGSGQFELDYDDRNPGKTTLTAVTEPEPANPVHRYTFEDGTANDSVGSAHGTLIGDATVAGGALVLDGDGDWMEMPGEVIAMNTYSEVSIETWFTSVAGGNTGFHMLAAFGEEGTGAADWAGYKYLFITPARGDDVSRAAIQTSSMDDSPWDEETGVSATVEHDDGLEHHFVCTVNATDIAFYIDGELIGSAALDPNNSISGISQAVAYLGKGVYPADPLWTGSINEFNIYDRALSLANVQANYAAGPVKPLVHQYTFEDGTANDSVGSAHGTLVGDATVVDGQLVLDGDGDWMDMPGDVIAMNTFEGLTIEIMFTSVAGGNTGFHMVTAFGEEGTGDNPGYGYKYVCITPARGNDVSRGMIQTVSMDNDPWSEETGVSDVIEHDDGLPHHMVCTVDDTELAFYIDGVLIGTAALDPPGNSIAGLGTDVAHIGKGVYGVDPLWAGSVEELNIYNRALSLAEVQANYAAGPQKAGPVPVDPGTEGLMLHLPLDTASRGVTQDSSDNNLDGTLFGDPTFVEGVDIMALQLDGVDDRVAIADDAAFDAMSEKFTITAWIKLSAEGTTDRRPILSKELEPDPDGRGWEFKVDNGRLAMQLYSPAEGEGKLTVTGTATLEAGQWYHVAGIYQADGLEQFYINGQLDHEQELVTALQANDSPANIGAYIWSPTGYQKYFAGLIDEVRIYDRALSTEEVLFLAGM